MKNHDYQNDSRNSAGFILPAVLIVMGALFIVAVGVLLVSGIERSTARSFVDHQRAELAAGAGLEQVRAILQREAANDDFVVLQSALVSPITHGGVPAAQVFIARGSLSGGAYVYRYIPLFSTSSQAPETSVLAVPEIEPLLGTNEGDCMDFSTHIYQDKVRAAWIPVRDGQNRMVARYAYSVEDLQGKLDPSHVGNLSSVDQAHVREPYSFPAPGVNPKSDRSDPVALDQVALFAIDPSANGSFQGTVGKLLIQHRSILLTPGSTLAAAHISPPLIRDAGGRLADVKARAVEENLTTNIQAYFERPLIPFASGIDPGIAGSPRMNLNVLLAKPSCEAVDQMAGHIRSALPQFDQRKGGFPDDYIKTLAANAIDYADVDSKPTLKAKEYRGLDVYPLMSEIALQVNYLGMSDLEGRKIMTFRFKVFAELFNPTSQVVTGDARLSYEVSLPMDGIGSGTGGDAFDAESLLSNPACSTHDLSLIGGRYWSRSVGVSLQANQYQSYLFADVTYRMDVGASSDMIPGSTPFSLNESAGASGLSLMWNGEVVDRAEHILRQQGLIGWRNPQGEMMSGFKVGTPKSITKAALPGHVYDAYPSMYYNMGDPRSTYYLRNARLDENAYPENTSPNRRNIRLDIYKQDANAKPKVYARVLPSEWPDGGHNALVGLWAPGTNDNVEMTDPKFAFAYDPQMRFSAPQSISNRGRFYSVTELGRVFDPIMHTPVFPGVQETDQLCGSGKMPESQDGWPDVAVSSPSVFYGGGNTLRIGRPEHGAFEPSVGEGKHAAYLLDLFHVGLSRSEVASDREGPVVRIAGHVNLNTASRDVLRALAAGPLVMDPMLSRQTSVEHDQTRMPPITGLSLSAPASVVEADRIADAIIGSRPYGSTAGLAYARESNGCLVFGNKALYPEGKRIEWSDAAAEETFARVYEAATVRSRNFRVWVVAQAIEPSGVSGAVPTVLAEVRKVYTVFADPGERTASGCIIPANFNTTLILSDDF